MVWAAAGLIDTNLRYSRLLFELHRSESEAVSEARQFVMCRGKGACDNEWKVRCSKHNLLKLSQSGWPVGQGRGKKTGPHPLEHQSPSLSRRQEAYV